MTAAPPPPRLPTLTEVVSWPATAPTPMPQVSSAEAQPLEGQAGIGLVTDAPPLNDDELIQRVLTELSRQVDLMLEYRLREVLSPLLSRATDNFIREARGELASTLRELVSRAVAQELTRHRTR
jgi:hypothetical protein